MRKRAFCLLGTIITICIASSNCFAQAVAEPKSDNNLNQQGQVKTIFSFKSEIGLTDDQEVKLKALLYDEQSFMDSENTSLKTLGTELSKMLENKESMQAIKSKLEEIAKVQVEVSYRNIEDSRKIEGILTPGQLAKWKDIQKKFSAQSKT